MKVYADIEQMTPEWFALKRGIPSSSKAGKILTPTGKLSGQSEGYLDQLLAERAGYGDEPCESTGWMERGLDLEPEARALFELEAGLDVQQVGWITNDAGTAGCSPDGLVDYAGLEIKCPKASTHIGYLRAGVMPKAYLPQVHFSMAVTGLTKWYFMSYFPGLDPLIIQVTADRYTDQVTVAIAEFIERLAEESERFGLQLPERKVA